MVASKVEDGFVNPNLHTNLKFLEDQLQTAPGGGPYICGEKLTAADIVLSYSVIAGLSRLGSLRDQYPTVVAYADRLQELEGYQRGVTKIEQIEGSFKANL